MSMTLVKPFFKARCLAVSLTEHPDGFAIDNIPSTLIDRSFHINFSSVTGRKLNQNDQEVEGSVEVVFYIKGYRNVSEGIDKAIEKAEALVKEVEKPANRLGSSLKLVTFQTMQLEPIDASNDNAIRARLVFNVLTILSL